MLYTKTKLGIRVMLLTLLTTGLFVSQSVRADHDDDDNNREEYQNQPVKIDRYLDVEVWPDHSDGEYYEGNNVVIRYRASADAFVAIYSIDTKGRVNLLFPSSRDEDNFVRGGITYDLPGDDDDYNLIVSGP